MNLKIPLLFILCLLPVVVLAGSTHVDDNDVTIYNTDGDFIKVSSDLNYSLLESTGQDLYIATGGDLGDDGVSGNTTEAIHLDKTPIPQYLDRVDGWTCYDYSMERTKQNPEWGIVLISTNHRFEGYKLGDNHFVNYKINDDKSLLIHDELILHEYTAHGWQHDTHAFEYYHFYINGVIPTRSWARNALKPNAEAVYNEL